MIDQLVQDGYAVSVVCKVLDYPRSTYYHTAQPTVDDELRAAIRDVSGQWPRYGYRRVTAELRRQHWVVNPKRIRRLTGALHRMCALDGVAAENQGEKAPYHQQCP